MENSNINKKDPFPQQEQNAFDTSANAELEWFNSYANGPGIFNNYTTEELKNWKVQMLIDLKKGDQ